jgi:putative transposase
LRRVSKRRRNSLRLRGYDYTQPGIYFVTVVLKRDSSILFGEVIEDGVRLNEYGEIVKECWEEIPLHFPNVLLDAFVVMPDHVHGILAISSFSSEKPCEVEEGVHKPCPGSLSAIMRSFKSAVTKEINIRRGTPGASIWHRSFYDRIVRNQKELERFRRYIVNNPRKWRLDRENLDDDTGAS